MGELLLINLSMHMMHLTTHYAAITGNEQEFSTRTIHLKKYILSSRSLPWTSSCKKSALHIMCNTTDWKTKSHPPTCSHQHIFTSTTNFNTYTPSVRKPELCTLYWPENTHKTNLPTPEATETGPFTKWWTFPDLEKKQFRLQNVLASRKYPKYPRAKVHALLPWKKTISLIHLLWQRTLQILLLWLLHKIINLPRPWNLLLPWNKLTSVIHLLRQRTLQILLLRLLPKIINLPRLWNLLLRLLKSQN